MRRRWHLDLHGIRREGSKESGFLYRDTDGRTIDDEKTLARIRRLRIPPAWREVRIARSDSAPLQAVGVDKKGRTQYRYHDRFRARREEEKFRRVVEFGESLPELRRRVRRDLHLETIDRARILASIVRLIDQGFFRVGNERSARSESTYGLTTVRGEHVKLRGNAVLFDYIGKWRKPNRRAIEDADVAAVIRGLRRAPDEKLFDVKDRHVNEYIHAMIGRDFTAKDFRTWAGTLLCFIALGIQGQGSSKAERKRKIKRAVQATAEQLGNTPAVCRSSYICPRILEEYTAGKPFELLRRSGRGRPVARVGLSMEEKALLRFLRETIADRRHETDRRREARPEGPETRRRAG